MVSPERFKKSFADLFGSTIRTTKQTYKVSLKYTKSKSLGGDLSITSFLDFSKFCFLKLNKKPLGLCLLGDRYFCNVITLIIIMVWLSGRARFLGVDFLSGQKS